MKQISANAVQKLLAEVGATEQRSLSTLKIGRKGNEVVLVVVVVTKARGRKGTLIGRRRRKEY